jgi:hypothetical protein
MVPFLSGSDLICQTELRHSLLAMIVHPHRVSIAAFILGPVEFIAYTEDVVDVYNRHQIAHHMFADDQQLHMHTTISSTAAVKGRLLACINDVRMWCAARRLQLNADKTELIWFGSHTELKKLSTADRSLIVDGTPLQPSEVIRDLGVLFDSEMTMTPHISKLTSVCYDHLRHIRQLRRHVDQPVLVQLASALILSRLDYCNVVLSGLPASTIAPLQRAQNAAAWLVFGLRPRDHVTPALIQLHWLPVAFRIGFKTAVFLYMVHTNHSPAYISQVLSTAASNPSRQSLRSANSTDYLMPRTPTKFGERAFSVSGPAIWNSLPESLRSSSNINIFKSRFTFFPSV